MSAASKRKPLNACARALGNNGKKAIPLSRGRQPLLQIKNRPTKRTIRVATRERMKNTVARTLVILTSFCSTVLLLFLPRKVSAPPAIAPERPAERPSWKRTMAISASEVMIRTIPNTISYQFMVENLQKILYSRILTHISCKCKIFFKFFCQKIHCIAEKRAAIIVLQGKSNYRAFAD